MGGWVRKLRENAGTCGKAREKVASGGKLGEREREKDRDRTGEVFIVSASGQKIYIYHEKSVR